MLEHHGMSTLSLSNNFISQSSVCGVCVLKREHHCMFAGYCVGHFNHRFFVLFLAWLWLGVLYCTYLNSLYVWTGEILSFCQHFTYLFVAEFENVSLSAMFKFVFPLLILMSGMDLSWTQVMKSILLLCFSTETTRWLYSSGPCTLQRSS